MKMWLPRLVSLKWVGFAFVLGAAPSLALLADDTRVYVANAENQTVPQVRYTGREWSVDQAGFLLGVGKGHRLLGVGAPGEGNFNLSLDLALGRVGRESSLVLDGTSEVVMAPGTVSWQVRGRFFRAGDEPISFAVPKLAEGSQFHLEVLRKGERVEIKINQTSVYEGPCGLEALSGVGLDPGTGQVHLYNFESVGRFPDAERAGRAFSNPFGMQLRTPPSTSAEVWAPVIVRVAPTNEASILRLQDGTIAVYSITKPASDSISVIESKDGGLTWSEPRIAFSIFGRAYYALKVIEGANGDLHAIYHLLGEGEGGYRGRLYEVYYTQLKKGTAQWSPALKVVPGYVGSIRGLLETQRGRLLLAVGKAVPEREQPPRSGPDYGWNDAVVYGSDDHGKTWTESPDRLKWELKTEFLTRYGAVEPVLVELKGGKIWMLVRDRGGRLIESFSEDGMRWSPLRGTSFISSDSPAELLRLRDGRLVLLVNACQNWSDPRSYAAGGREVLQAAVSRDEGKTWSGFREVLHETNLVGGGDRGTAYASAAETADGKVIFVSGQGHGKHAIAMFDPDWLEEKRFVDALEQGPVFWTQYGDERLQVVTTSLGEHAVSIPMKSSGLCGASLNFPMTATGRLQMRVFVPEGVKSVTLSLNDHFTRVDDSRAAQNAVYSWTDTSTGGWTNLTLVWEKATTGGHLSLLRDGKPVATVPCQRKPDFGVNYLNIEFNGKKDSGALLVSRLSMEAGQ